MATPAGVLVEVIGLVAAVLTTFAFLPQALRIWNTGSLLQAVYGLLIGSVLFVKIRDMLRPGSLPHPVTADRTWIRI